MVTRPFRYCSGSTVRTSRLKPTLTPELSASPLTGTLCAAAVFTAGVIVFTVRGARERADGDRG